MQRRILFTFVLFVSSFFFPSSSLHAQVSAGLTVVPSSIERAADPGTEIREILKITNEGTDEKEYFIYKKNIKGVEGGGVPIFADDEAEKTGYELSEWVEIPTEPIRVPAQSSYDLPLLIKVPSSATPGSHFGGVFVSAEPPKLRTLGAGVGYEVATIISIRISGDIIDTARIRSFATDKLLYTSKNVNFETKVENQGNILIRPRGPLTITSMFSSKPEVFTMNDTQAGVFPGTTREFSYEWRGEGLGFGRYEAVLALVYDGKDGQTTIDATTVFWVFPGKIMAMVLGGFLLIFGLGYLFTRYYINQAIMRAAGGRRIVPQRYRKQVGISRFAFVFSVILGFFALFLIALLIFFA